jgi:CheY-like chemotaxis protein
MTVVLKDMGIKVTSTSDGTQALNLINCLRPGLIISDIDIPGIDGISLFKAVRSDTSGLADTPFILMSSVDRMREARRAGCMHFLTKPFSIADVQQIIRNVLPGNTSE